MPRTDAEVDSIISGLVEQLESAQRPESAPEAGSFMGERRGVHSGGVTALVTLALLTAGVPWHDPVIEGAVAYLEEHPLPGTYSRSLRAAVWAHLAMSDVDHKRRQEFSRLLQRDTDWLVRAMKPDGYYGYDRDGLGGDHSCTQFGVLGVWSAEGASGEVSREYWERVSDHWLSHQRDDGSWAYADSRRGTVTMTTAGVNTLYVTLAQLLAKREPRYRALRGVPSSGRHRVRLDRTLRAAQRGMAWLSERAILVGGPYQLFGLERLGVAGGRKYIGSTDWYRAGVDSIDSKPGNTTDAAFALLFLTYGRAAVLFNKLEYGHDHRWNYYYRDLHFLTRWLSERHERIYKWQIVGAGAPLHDLLDAPILLISGATSLDLNAAGRHRLREYVDAGGTIVGHADKSSARFALAFRETFERLFADRGWVFEHLAPDHPLFSSVHGRGDPAWSAPFEVQGMDDGLRTCVILLPKDIAGAWHQNLHLRHPAMFHLMGNLRAYAAPQYARLPKRLRAREDVGPSAVPIGYLTVATIAESGLRGRIQRWERMGRLFSNATGVSLIDIGASSDRADIIHLSGTRALRLNDGAIGELAEQLRGGGFLLMESAGGSAEFSVSAGRLLQNLSKRSGGTIARLDSDHPVLRGVSLAAGKPVGRWMHAPSPPDAVGTGRRNTAVEITALLIDGRVAAVHFPVDLLATATGHYLFRTAAYTKEQSRAILFNLLTWRYVEIAAAAVPRVPGRLPRRHPNGGLLGAARQAHDAGDHVTSANVCVGILRLRPEYRDAIALRDALKTPLVRLATEAIRDGRFDESYRLARLLDRLDPDEPDEGTAIDQIIGRLEEQAGQLPRPTGLPADLADVAVRFNDQDLTALVLLEEWMKWDAQRTKAKHELAELVAREKLLIERVRRLAGKPVGRRARRGTRGRAGGSGDRRSKEVQKIAGERRSVEAAIAEVHEKLASLDNRMEQITDVLTPIAARLAEYGIKLDGRRWVHTG
ncbi:MAG: DUF4159 domain-containing protein [Planctomycetes bacterium]|nr:DUF4159 domain-containing protein [Planctomycetota bacterium]